MHDMELNLNTKISYFHTLTTLCLKPCQQWRIQEFGMGYADFPSPSLQPCLSDLPSL